MKLLGLLGKSPYALAVKAAIVVAIIGVVAGSSYFKGRRDCNAKHQKLALVAEQKQAARVAQASRDRQKRDLENERKANEATRKVLLANTDDTKPLRECLGDELSALRDDRLRNRTRPAE